MLVGGAPSPVNQESHTMLEHRKQLPFGSVSFLSVQALGTSVLFPFSQDLGMLAILYSSETPPWNLIIEMESSWSSFLLVKES